MNGATIKVIKVQKLHPDAVIPSFAHSGDSGADLYSIDTTTILGGCTKLIHTGIAVKIPLGFEGQIRPRSGNALKFGYTVLNTPGTIDSNYRGEIGVLIFNSGRDYVQIKKGDRIAQLVIQELPSIFFEEVEELDDSNRGQDGFGSTGR
jgi:dUTP pyrophosphatase